MDLHDLLSNKAFEELDAKEQEFVLNQMSQETYKIERGAVLASLAFFKEEEQKIRPSLTAPNKALLALKEQRERVPFWKVLLLYKIPAWQAAAAVVLVFFLMNGLGGKTTETELQLLANGDLRDTVFIDKYITKSQTPDTVVKVIYKALKGTSTKQMQPKPLASNSVTSEERQTKAVSREFDNVLQYCNTSPSVPASKDTFLQLLSSEVLF